MRKESVGYVRPTILIINDYGELNDYYKNELGEICKVMILDSSELSGVQELLYRFKPDCVMTSKRLLHNNVQAIKTLKEFCDSSFIPMISVINTRQTEACLVCEYGLNDVDEVILNPADPVELHRKINNNLNKRDKILSNILIDPLTGVYTSEFLRKEVEEQLNVIKRSHEPFSLVYMEIDNLPVIQRNYGYSNGHRMLLGFAEFIQDSIRPTDLLAHYNSEGFVLVLPKTVKIDAMKLMNRLIQQFSQLQFQTQLGNIRITFSANVLDFANASIEAEECLKLIPFPSDMDPSIRKACVLDGDIASSNTSVRKLKIAVIDDDRLIREMLKYQLEDIGDSQLEVEVKVYHDGEEFFQDPWHRQNERFLLIIDRIMPKMDGLEVLQKIRTQYDRNRYACLMLTSRSAEAEITLAMQRGANDYLTKPFSVKELRARINRLIKGSR